MLASLFSVAIHPPPLLPSLMPPVMGLVLLIKYIGDRIITSVPFFPSPLLFLRALGSWGEEDRMNNGAILHPRFPHSVTAVTWSLTGSGRVTSVLFSADVKWESKWFRR